MGSLREDLRFADLCVTVPERLSNQFCATYHRRIAIPKEWHECESETHWSLATRENGERGESEGNPPGLAPKVANEIFQRIPYQK